MKDTRQLTFRVDTDLADLVEKVAIERSKKEGRMISKTGLFEDLIREEATRLKLRLPKAA